MDKKEQVKMLIEVEQKTLSEIKAKLTNLMHDSEVIIQNSIKNLSDGVDTTVEIRPNYDDIRCKINVGKRTEIDVTIRGSYDEDENGKTNYDKLRFKQDAEIRWEGYRVKLSDPDHKVALDYIKVAAIVVENCKVSGIIFDTLLQTAIAHEKMIQETEYRKHSQIIYNLTEEVNKLEREEKNDKVKELVKVGKSFKLINSIRYGGGRRIGYHKGVWKNGNDDILTIKKINKSSIILNHGFTVDGKEYNLDQTLPLSNFYWEVERMLNPESKDKCLAIF